MNNIIDCTSVFPKAIQLQILPDCEVKPIEYSEKTKDKRYNCAKQAGYNLSKNAKIHRPMTKDKNEQLCLGMEG